MTDRATHDIGSNLAEVFLDRLRTVGTPVEVVRRRSGHRPSYRINGHLCFVTYSNSSFKTAFSIYWWGHFQRVFEALHADGHELLVLLGGRNAGRTLTAALLASERLRTGDRELLGHNRLELVLVMPFAEVARLLANFSPSAKDAIKISIPTDGGPLSFLGAGDPQRVPEAVVRNEYLDRLDRLSLDEPTSAALRASLREDREAFARYQTVLKETPTVAGPEEPELVEIGQALRTWCVYVNPDAAANFRLSREQSLWGAKERRKLEGIAKGDALVFVHHLEPAQQPPPQGWPRLQPAPFREAAGRVRLVVSAVATSEPFEDDSVVWPDGTFPYRFRFEEMGEQRDVDVHTAWSPELLEAFRLSVINTGKAQLVGAEASPAEATEPAAADGAPAAVPATKTAPEPVRPPPLTLDRLEELTLWEREDLERLCEAVRDGGSQVMLAGPPGTSKTWVARYVAAYLTQAPEQILRKVQFHPSYGYEEFVEGLRPVANTEGVITFDTVPGVVVQMVHDIGATPGPHVLLIDEINRANLPKVFGELLYLLEYREERIDLRFTRGFALPASLRLLGTMNTADRSIRSLDTALRRRFSIVECPPDRSILERYYRRHTNEVDGLLDGFERLNTELASRRDRHHTIGHTFFMADPMTTTRLKDVWATQIGPLIEEYFFDDPDSAAWFSLDRFWPAVVNGAGE